MRTEHLDATYWNERYSQCHTPWDIGSISTPLKAYLDQLTHKEIKLLVPGGGNSHEAEYAFDIGFLNTYVVDFSRFAKEAFATRVPQFPIEQFLIQDFFDLEVQYDMVLEQTFFCALAPRLRKKYAEKVATLLKPGGRLVGLLFDFPLKDGPPFGGSKSEYLGYFEPFFEVSIFERCYNSIPSRVNKEFFINLHRK